MLQQLIRLLSRFRHPVSLPEDVAQALGLEISNLVSFKTFIETLTSRHCCPTRLKRFMNRGEAEAAFVSALRKEQFRHNTLCSYYFNDGWLEFDLRFDEENRLRRIYIHHRDLHLDQGVELHLSTPVTAQRPAWGRKIKRRPLLQTQATTGPRHS